MVCPVGFMSGSKVGEKQTYRTPFAFLLCILWFMVLQIIEGDSGQDFCKLCGGFCFKHITPLSPYGERGVSLSPGEAL